MSRDQASVVETQPEIAMGSNGQRLLAKEIVVLINIPKKGTLKPSNVIVRGIEENSLLSSAPGQTCQRTTSEDRVPWK